MCAGDDMKLVEESQEGRGSELCMNFKRMQHVSKYSTHQQVSKNDNCCVMLAFS